MGLMVFSEKMVEGVGEIDKQHRQLIAIINALYNIALGRSDCGALGDVFAELAAYTASHLEHEEKLFADAGYPGLAAHKASHDDLRKRVAEYCAQQKKGDAMILALDLLHFLKQWLTNHMLGDDKDACAYLNEHGIY